MCFFPSLYVWIYMFMCLRFCLDAMRSALWLTLSKKKLKLLLILKVYPLYLFEKTQKNRRVFKHVQCMCLEASTIYNCRRKFHNLLHSCHMEIKHITSSRKLLSTFNTKQMRKDFTE